MWMHVLSILQIRSGMNTDNFEWICHICDEMENEMKGAQCTYTNMKVQCELNFSLAIYDRCINNNKCTSNTLEENKIFSIRTYRPFYMYNIHSNSFDIEIFCSANFMNYARTFFSLSNSEHSPNSSALFPQKPWAFMIQNLFLLVSVLGSSECVCI